MSRCIPLAFPLGIALTLSLAGCARGAGDPATTRDSGWGAYGGDPGGGRFSPLRQIDTANVNRLALAWTYRTGDATHDDHGEGPRTGCGRCHTGASKFEATPILADGRLYLSTPLNRVIALDPAQGHELWRFDPKLDLSVERSEGFVSRGVAYWKGAPGSGCAARIFFATVDARLFALDAERGTPCPGFGEAGTVHLDRGVGEVEVGQYGVTSPPAVLGDLVIVGSAIGDNRRVDLERGVVRAFDATSGAERWSFDPIPRNPSDPAYRSWDSTAARVTGGGNAWAPLSVDTALGLVFVPTGSAAPDFFGGLRPGDNRYTSSVVALEGRTGRVRWHFQVVHHDLWDFDVASQPVLLTVPRGGREIPAVAVATKLGHLFVLDRTTGEPLFPVEERAVPASDVPGEVAAATQPFPVLPKPLFDGPLTRDSLWGLDDAERDACRAQFDRLRAGPIFTPPSLAGTSPRRVSRVLDAFVRRCLMKNPAARPESADDLASTLLAIPATEAPLTSDAEAAARMRRARLWGRGWPVVLPRRAFQFDTGSLGHCTALDDPPETIRRRRDDAGVLGTLGAIEPEPPSLDGLSLEAMMETSLDAEGKAQSPIARVERTTLPPPPVHISTLPPPSTVPRRLLGTPCLATLPSPPFPGYEVRAFPRRNGGSTPPSLR